MMLFHLIFVMLVEEFLEVVHGLEVLLLPVPLPVRLVPGQSVEPALLNTVLLLLLELVLARHNASA